MMKVKIVKNKSTELLERDINEALEIIGSKPNTKVDLKDIKIVIGPSMDHYVGVLIYNITNIR